MQASCRNDSYIRKPKISIYFVKRTSGPLNNLGKFHVFKKIRKVLVGLISILGRRLKIPVWLALNNDALFKSGLYHGWTRTEI